MKSDNQKKVASILADWCYKVSRLIHWVSVALVITLLIIALFGGIDPHGAGNRAFLWHSSLGIVLYLLTISRVFLWLIYRLQSGSMDSSGSTNGISRTLRTAFYGLLIALPVSGWFLASEEGMHSSMLETLALPQWYHEPTIQHTASDTPVIVWLSRVHSGLAAALFLVVTGHLIVAIRGKRTC